VTLIDPDECLTHNSTQCTDLEASKDVAALDVTDPDACHRFFTGADAVVHLAAVPDPAASWERLLPANVVGAYQVAEAAANCGVRRLVLASSLHAVSAVPAQTQVRTADAPRPVNLYGLFVFDCGAMPGQWVHAARRAALVSRIRA
jgi:nucleoside-diphosphate-sugar epimerase